MLFDKLRNYSNILVAILDGVYGWIDEAIAIAIFVVLFNFLAKRGLKSLHKYFEKTNQIWKDSFVQALYRPLSVFVWFFAVIHILDLISQYVFESTILSNLHQIIIISFAMCVAWFSMRWKRLIVFNIRAQSSTFFNTMDAAKIDVIDKVVTMFILFICILFILEFTGQNINTLIAFGGVGGLAIAFAAQEMIANFFGGFMIYMTHPFMIGDWINLPERNLEGYVEEIGWYMTRVRTFEKRPIYIPNSMFSKVVVMTPSRMSHQKFEETISIRYSDMPVARAIIKDIKDMLKHHAHIDHHLSIYVHLTKFGSYSVDIRVAAYLLDINLEAYAETKQDLLFKIYDILREHQAEMPYPTTQVRQG